jgi:TRAP-type C4-dicarboxylate transport system substrate-binding protein
MHMTFKRTLLAVSALLMTAALLPAHAAVFKLAMIAPEGSEWMLEHRKAAAEIKERTAGRVALKFYGGGVMGNDRKVLRKMRIGQLQGAVFSSSGLVERYPDIMLYGMPFLFNSLAEVDYVRERLDLELVQGLKDAGFVSFGFAGGGFANFMSNEPITTPDSLKGNKIWVPEGDTVSFTTLESMDLSPVVLPISDVLTGLQTGLLDVIVTPPQGALLLQWYTKVKYINPLPIAYTLGVLALDTRAFDRLDAADQMVFTEVMTATYQRLGAINRRDNVAAEEALLANGLKMAEADKASIPYWRGIAKEVNDKIWNESAVNPALYERLQALLAEHRAAAAGVDGGAGQPSADAGM